MCHYNHSKSWNELETVLSHLNKSVLKTTFSVVQAGVVEKTAFLNQFEVSRKNVILSRFSPKQDVLPAAISVGCISLYVTLFGGS